MEKMNFIVFFVNNCLVIKFYWYFFMFFLEDVMYKSIVTEYIKL